MTLYRETLCEHGRIDCPGYVDDKDGLPIDPAAWLASLGNTCPGGSHEAVTIDYEAMIKRFKELCVLPEVGGTEGGLQLALSAGLDAALQADKEPASA